MTYGVPLPSSFPTKTKIFVTDKTLTHDNVAEVWDNVTDYVGNYSVSDLTVDCRYLTELDGDGIALITLWKAECNSLKLTNLGGQPLAMLSHLGVVEIVT